jgi:hypothetical protein
MRITSAVMTAVLALATGCVGGIDDYTPMPATPDAATVDPTAKQGKQLYVTTVHSIMTAKCGTAACHGQTIPGIYGWVQADANASYDMITGLPTLVGTYTPATAAILTKVDSTVPHYTATYTADDKAKITAWLAAEIADRENDPTQPQPIDPIQKLREWSGCMSLENFQAANMTQAWGNLTAQQQLCRNCHGTGLYAFMSGDGQNAQQFFNTITSQRDLLLKYFTVDGTGQVVINTAAMQNAGVTLQGHPRFNPTMNAGMTALAQFHELTLQRQTAAECDPPRLPEL